jgi:hypothetical protein
VDALFGAARNTHQASIGLPRVDDVRDLDVVQADA